MTDLSWTVPVLLAAESFGACAWMALRAKGWRGRGAFSCFVPVFGCFALIFAAGAPDLEARRLAGEEPGRRAAAAFRMRACTASAVVLALMAGAVAAGLQGKVDLMRLCLSCAIIAGTGSAGLLALLAKGWTGWGGAAACCFIPGISLLGVAFACAAPDLVLRRRIAGRKGEGGERQTR